MSTLSVRCRRYLRGSVAARIGAALALAILLAGPGGGAHAAGIVVKSNADGDLVTLQANTTCDLREAITNANSNDQSGSNDCPAGSGADTTDTITFDQAYTITLASPLPTITSKIAITGAGAASTILEAGTCNPVTTPGGCTPAGYRVFSIDGLGNLTLDSLTVRHGNCVGACATQGSYGGGALNYGTLTVQNGSRISDNQAGWGGGVNNYGTLIVQSGGTIGGAGTGNKATDSGGGIFTQNGSSVTIDAGTLSANSATHYGGGIMSYGTLTVQNGSTIGGAGAGNTAGNWGGGIQNESTASINASTVSHNSAPSGGGIYSYQTGASLTIDAGTISDNTATVVGGGIYNGATLTVQNGSTIGGQGAGNSAVGSGGGIYNSGTASVTGSRILYNSAGNDGDAVYDIYVAEITGSCIVGNGPTAVVYLNGPQAAAGNWWGDPAGPGSVGPSVYGDTINANVDYSGFLTSPILGCPIGRTPPALSSPKNGAAVYTKTPKLTWKSQKTATGYHVDLDDDNGFLNPLQHTDTTTPYYTATSLPFGTYFWQVSAKDTGGWSTPSLPYSFDVTLLKSPGKNATTSDRTPKFTWMKVAGTGVHYHIRVWDDQGCKVNQVFEREALKPTYTTPNADTLGLGTYYWQVTSDDWGTETPCWRFDVTTLKSPKSGAAVSSLTPKFTWLKNKQAAGYQLNVVRRPDDGSADVPAIVNKQTTTPTYTAKLDGLDFGHYLWHIQEDVSGFGPATPDGEFYLTNMVSPKNNLFTLNGKITFKWKKVTDASYYAVKVSDDPTNFDIPAFTYATQKGLKATAILPRGTYYWRVEAGGKIMPVWTFTVGP